MTVALTRRLVAGIDALLDADINEAIDIAMTRIDSTEWGAMYSQAVALMAGHILQRVSVPGATVAAGGIASESAGGLSRSYGSVGGAHEMATTQAGSDYLALQRRTILPARIV